MNAFSENIQSAFCYLPQMTKNQTSKNTTKDVFNILSRQEQDEKDCLEGRHSA